MKHKIFKMLGIILAIASFTSCGNGNYKKIIITGTVKDSKSNFPIENASIKIKCWAYNIQKWESDSLDKEVLTNSKGEFFIDFIEGEAIDINVIANGYNNYNSSLTLNKSKIDLLIKLEQ